MYIGYRWYDAKKLDVEYPFGYGLSYTSFAYSDIHLDKSGMSVNDNVTVSFIVKNTGSRAGSDVAQVYVRDVVSSINRPVKELRGFRKVYLKPGEEQEVSVTLDRRAFECYTPALHKWVVEGGEYEILVGRSSREILLTASVMVDSAEAVKRFSPQAQVGHFVKEPQFKEALSTASKAVQEFFDPDKNPILPLGLAIPFGQFGDADLGQGKLNQELIQNVVSRLNVKDNSLELPSKLVQQVVSTLNEGKE